MSNRSFFQETFLGLVLRKAAGTSSFVTKTLGYAEDAPDFKAPEKLQKGYKTQLAAEQGHLHLRKEIQNSLAVNDPPTATRNSSYQTQASYQTAAESFRSADEQQGEDPPSRADSDNTAVGLNSEKPAGQKAAQPASSSADSSPETAPDSVEAEDDPYLVDWWSAKDPDNPQNWSLPKKLFVTGLICLLTTSVYIGSAIYTPGIPYISQEFGVGTVTATLGLSLFVFGYAVGPLLGLCAASEIPAIGRTIPYIICTIIFVVLQVPTALATNIAGFMILRFIGALFASPPLATGGATMADIYGPRTRPRALAAWGISAVAGPVLGPVVGGFASAGFMTWRWTIWPVLFLAGFTLIVIFFTLPETSASNILLRRTQRLRKVTGNDKLRSKGEIIAAGMDGKEILAMILIRPFKLSFIEPIVFSINLHIGLVYGVLYLWFEAFPIVFVEMYGFNAGESGIAFMGIFVFAFLAFGAYFAWLKLRYEPQFDASKGQLEPEIWLEPAMIGAWFLPIAIFAFGWTSTASIHWMVPIIASGLFSFGTFAIFSAGLNYLADAYPLYIASTFAANDAFRGCIGAALPLVARAMFTNLQAKGPTAFPVAWGCTLIGCISLLLAPIPIFLYIYGPKLRKMSKYATTPGQAAPVV